ncbi:sugar ABC transporter permease [Nonomuraea pusilla]|uniref:carbohydrate ABC transporter permease n=1 Tax=Nonomuraea pusilla TaxID=46177 RepID=UPI003318CBA9
MTTSLRTQARAPGAAREGDGGWRRRGAILLFVGPFFALFLAVIVAPLAYAVYLSLFSEKSSGLGFGGAQTVFVGLGNYLDTLRDEAFTDGFLVILGYCVLYIPLMIGGALTLALLLDSGLARFGKVFQAALFMPHIVPGVIAGLIWLYLYLPGISPIVDLLGDADFLGGRNALGAVVNIALWEWLGYNMIIYFAALQAIPAEVVEAARMDGAGGARIAWSVKIPMIRGAVVTTVLFTIIGSLQLFTEPTVLDNSSDGIVSTWTPNMYAYNEAFGNNDIGQAGAASIILALLAAVLSYAVTRWGNRR